MTIELSQRAQHLQASPTLALDKRANTLKQLGEPIINLSVGQPDFDTPAFIRQAGIDAINAGYSRYTPVDGLPALKQAICQKLDRDNALAYQPEQILVSSGAKQSIYNALAATLNPGDEVLIPAPYWVSYPEMVKLNGATPVIIEAPIEQDYKITADQLKSHLSARTKILILNSPVNPTGMVYTFNELKALGEVLTDYPNVYILSDDIYEHLCLTATFYNIINTVPELKDQTILINGVSKAYAMTGWRIGYAAGPETVIAAMKKIQSQTTSCPNAIAQKAAEAAINSDQNCVKTMVQAFKKRHDLVYEGLKGLSYTQVIPSQGAFYNFINVQEAVKAQGFNTDTELAEALLTQAHVALVPGSAFGAPGHMRLSFASDERSLNQALQQLKHYGL